MGAEGRSHVPRHGGAHRTQHKTNDAACQGVLHGPIGCEPGREVAARDPEDRAIDGRKQEERVARRLAQRRENAACVQHDVGAERKNDDGDKARERAPMLRPIWRGRFVSLMIRYS